MDEGAAIRAFARTRFRALAEELAAQLRERSPSDIYGDDIGAKSIWDEYCYETRNGPTFELIDAWSSLLDPLIADLIARTSHEEAVLLTVAEQWYCDADESRDDCGELYSNPDLITQAIFQSFRELAVSSDSSKFDEDEEINSEWRGDEPAEGLCEELHEVEDDENRFGLPDTDRSGSQPNTDIDREITQAGIVLAGYHIEKGARTFAAFAQAMMDELGDVVRPYLRMWYEGVRFYPGMEDIAREMSSAEDIDAALTALEADSGNQRNLISASAGAAR